MTLEVGALRNPYLDVFLKYVETEEWWPGHVEWVHKGAGYREIVVHHGPQTHRLDRLVSGYQVKEVLQRRFSWGVPNDAAIQAIAKLGKPVIEIGAGTGYWCWLLDQAGVKSLAFDKFTDDANFFVEPEHWVEVEQGDEHVLKLGYQNYALLLCWPPYAEPMAVDCLTAFLGDTLIYVGEGPTGCTGDDAFFNELDKHWVERETVSIPQWPGLHDYLTIFERK